MEKVTKVCHQVCEKGIKWIALVLLAFLTCLTLFFQNSISFDILETSTIQRNGVKFWVLLILALLLLHGVIKLLDKVPETALFVFFSLLYLVAGVYLITHIQMNLRYDSGICFWNAQNFVTGNYSNLQFGEYFYKYPHQLGLVSYNCLLLLLSDSPNFVYYMNLLWIVVAQFWLWRSLKIVWGDRTLLRKIVMLLSFCFLPQFFYLFYAYGQVPGMAFLTIALYFAVRAIHKETGWCVVPMLLFIAAACVVRMNYAIGGIAMIIVYLLYALKRRKWIYLAVILCVGLSIVLPKNLVNYYYEKVADTDLSQGMPFSLHIAMGLQENEEPWRAAGWYNDFNDKTYLNSECDVGMAHRIAMKSIEDRLHTFLTNPGYAVDFFGEKIITTWCEPTFQSIWSGPLISMNNTTEVPLLHDLYSGGAVFGILASAMNALSVMIFGFSAAYILWKIFRDKSALNVLELFGIVFFMGGFLFHLAWETKSQYVYPYVILLIPVAGNGVHMVFSSLQKKIGEGRQRKSPISPS